ncbi:hypothetical protein [Peptostreptococcus stomatis]|uniref:hypothetical protein n=1 Tax=Peptostreptococcus stomatis TaxID=341694 RepID=UPI001A36D360|nr:hypothetical protein [Peptostreptococcus stomatis]MBL6465422.1 hypothetical protein [Peptostreptococcus stomatis]
METKVLFIIFSIEAMMIYVFMDKKARHKIPKYIMLILSIYFVKELAIASKIDEDVLWGINLISNFLIIVNIAVILVKYIYLKNKK